MLDRRLKRSEYDRLVELGAFEREKIELIRGLLVTMSPIGTRHSEAVRRLTRLLVQGSKERADVQIQSPFAAADDSEPEPDVAVVPHRDYSGQHPAEAFLIIEVADRSLAFDRREKAALYAETGVREYWIVNLCDDVIEVHRGPQASGRWDSVTTARAGETIAPVAFPDLVVDVAALLPRRTDQ